MDRAQEIRETIKPLMDELNQIERAERDRERQSLVGRCFKFHNSYSCPESDADRWWAYKKITCVSDEGVECLCFEKDKHGKIEIDVKSFSGRVSGGWTEISISEYMNAWADLIDEVNSINPAA